MLNSLFLGLLSSSARTSVVTGQEIVGGVESRTVSLIVEGRPH